MQSIGRYADNRLAASDGKWLGSDFQVGAFDKYAASMDRLAYAFHAFEKDSIHLYFSCMSTSLFYGEFTLSSTMNISQHRVAGVP